LKEDSLLLSSPERQLFPAIAESEEAILISLSYPPLKGSEQGMGGTHHPFSMSIFLDLGVLLQLFLTAATSATSAQGIFATPPTYDEHMHYFAAHQFSAHE
jgi:hypothetical protein